jgi:CRISPR type IV-associated protein Csf2
MRVRLTGLFTLRAPLSHIGETISNTAYLNQEPIVQTDGTTAEVFVYNGNAWRGQLRDLMAGYMLDRLGLSGISLDAFMLLFGGGAIGGEQSTDLAQARRFRRAVPLLSLLGGGVGNQILPGKLRVGNGYPLCREAVPVLPSERHAEARPLSYRSLTLEKELTRTDDTKSELLRPYLEAPRSPAALTNGQAALLEMPPVETPRGKRSGRGEDQSWQMRFATELVAAGTRLTMRIDTVPSGISEIELGCLVSGLDRFAGSPYIGGQSTRGHGLVDLEMDLIDLDTRMRAPFFGVRGGELALFSPEAEAAKAAYDGYLDAYHDAIDDRRSEIAGLLGAPS